MNLHLLYAAIDGAHIAFLSVLAIRLLALAPRNRNAQLIVLLAFGAVCAVVSARHSYMAVLPAGFAVDLGPLIATLRALGFHAVPVVVSVLVEATVLALAGGILGAAVVYAALDGYNASTLNPAAGSQLAFAFRVTLESLWLALGWAIALGVIGGMAPAMRASRLPITTVLRGA